MITLKGRREPGGCFRDDTQILLNKGHMRRLVGLDLNAMMVTLEHGAPNICDSRENVYDLT